MSRTWHSDTLHKYVLVYPLPILADVCIGVSEALLHSVSLTILPPRAGHFDDGGGGDVVVDVWLHCTRALLPGRPGAGWHAFIVGPHLHVSSRVAREVHCEH